MKYILITLILLCGCHVKTYDSIDGCKKAGRIGYHSGRTITEVPIQYVNEPEKTWWQEGWMDAAENMK